MTVKSKNPILRDVVESVRASPVILMRLRNADKWMRFAILREMADRLMRERGVTVGLAHEDLIDALADINEP